MSHDGNGAVRDTVRSIFLEELDLDVAGDTDLLADGTLDSTGFVQLLLALEERFGVTIDVAELDLDDFSSIDRIASFVRGRRTHHLRAG